MSIGLGLIVVGAVIAIGLVIMATREEARTNGAIKQVQYAFEATNTAQRSQKKELSEQAQLLEHLQKQSIEREQNISRIITNLEAAFLALKSELTHLTNQQSSSFDTQLGNLRSEISIELSKVRSSADTASQIAHSAKMDAMASKDGRKKRVKRIEIVNYNGGKYKPLPKKVLSVEKKVIDNVKKKMSELSV